MNQNEQADGLENMVERPSGIVLLPHFPVQLYGVYDDVSLLAARPRSNVYVATNRETGKRVAIKKSITPCAQDDTRSDVFLKPEEEAILLLRFSDHPGIINVEGIHNVDGAYVLATEYLPQKTKELIVSYDAKSLGNFLLGLSNILNSLKQKGIVHRDIKPSNLGGIDNRLVLFDFELAIDMGTQTHVVIPNNLLAGTPGFIAPECHKGVYSHESDVYAVGQTVMERLSETYPRPTITNDGQTFPNSDRTRRNNSLVTPSARQKAAYTCIELEKLRESKILDAYSQSPLLTQILEGCVRAEDRITVDQFGSMVREYCRYVGTPSLKPIVN